MAALLNFDNLMAPWIEQGATFRYTFKVTVPPINFALYTVKMQIRSNYGGTLIAELSTQNNKIFLDSNNDLNLFLTHTETWNIIPGNYIYDIEITKISDGKVINLFNGNIIVSPGVTRF
jgi:hypothetical protein